MGVPETDKQTKKIPKGIRLPTHREYNPDVYKKEWRYQDGDLTVTRTTQWTGPGCHMGCGILVYTDKKGTVVKVEGDPNNPINDGVLCMRCLNLIESLESPDRLKWPLKRVGERGENNWERITWDEAYDLIVEKTRYFQKKFGKRSIMVNVGTGRNAITQASVLAYAGFQTPNYVSGFLAGDACFVPRAMAMFFVAGGFGIADLAQTLPNRFDDPRYELPEVILIWGNNPIMTNADAFFGHWIVEAMRRGTKLIVVDPKLTWLAAKADVWLRVRPGTDAVIALAMLRVIIDEEIYDKKFVEEWCHGFESLVERVHAYDIDKMAELAWVPKEKIIKAARMFAAARPASVQWGVTIDHSVAAITTAQAINILWAITGNIDVPGGMILVSDAFGIDSSPNAALMENPPDEWPQRIGAKDTPVKQILAHPHGDEALTSVEAGEIKMAWMHETNPIANMAAEAPRVYAAMKKVEFVVSVDLYVTPTAVAFADIILPAAMGPEREGIRAWWTPLRSITKTSSFHEAKSDDEIILDMIQRLNPSAAPGKDVTDWLNNNLAKSTAGVTYEELKERVIVWEDWQYRRYENGLLRSDGEPGFNTPSGKVELKASLLEMMQLDPLPYYEEPRESPYSTPELAQKYPFVLTTGARSFEFFHSEHRQLPTMRKFHPNPVCEIHPDAAKKLGISDGDWVWIENQRGRCKQQARLNKTLDPRVVTAEHGWWFPEREGAEPSLFGVFDSNINNLTVQNVVGPTGFGAPYKNLLCKVYKVEPQNDLVQPTTQVTRMGGFDYGKR
jgi:anaerobic selenocysteine-containing dehydrogenase